MKNYMLISIVFILLASCVSQKKFQEIESQSNEQLELIKEGGHTIEALRADLEEQENKLLIATTELSNERSKTNSLEKQLEYFKSANANLLDRLSDLAVVSKSGAESIKKSLEALNEQNRYIKDLTSSIQRKDSVNLILVMNLKRALSNFEDEDITIEVKKGVVYVSISDKMLFESGSHGISARAEEVLGKIAKVVNDHDQLDILVEGHTDSVPISTTCMVDNWDLSVKRATAVVRLLQNKYNVNPQRMTAGGRSEYIPKSSNETDRGKALNRRTEIVILPKLDEFFQLLEPPVAQIDKM